MSFIALPQGQGRHEMGRLVPGGYGFFSRFLWLQLTLAGLLRDSAELILKSEE